MTTTRFAQIDRQIDSFPAPPDTVAKVLQVTSNPESGAADLLEAVQSDPAMCTAILQVANSPLFGHSRNVSSLEQAIPLLGFDEVESIVLSKAVVSTFHGLLPKHKEGLQEFWNHSFTCGLAAKIIAVHLNLESGRFFMAGLIHDTGKLAMLLSFPEEFSQSATSYLEAHSSLGKIKSEREQYGICHDVVGGRLLQKWNFPHSLVLAVGFHHAPDKAPKYRGYPLIIQLADALAHFCRQPEALGERDIGSGVRAVLPAIDQHWQASGMTLDNDALESWFAWLKIDQAHGSPILKIMAAR